MKLTYFALASVLLAKSFKGLTNDTLKQPEPITPEKPPEYLELPDDLPKILILEGSYQMEESGAPLPPYTADVFRQLSSKEVWFSKARKYITEEEWVYVLIAENPLATLALKLRTLELKFQILKKQI